MWSDVPQGEKIGSGRYRAIFNVQSPYNRDIVGKVIGALKTGAGVASHIFAPLIGNVNVEDVVVVPPATIVSGRNPLWSIYVVFTRKTRERTQTQTRPGELAPQFEPIEITGLVILGAILAIIAVVLGISVLSRRLQKDVVEPATNLAQALVPGLILLVLGAYVIKGGR